MSYKKLDRCPRDAACNAKKLFLDEETNKLYGIVRNDLIPHKCNVKGASEMPKILYVAEWYNKRTRRTRYIGPTRLEKSVRKAPHEEGRRNPRNAQESDWELKGVYMTGTNWKPVRD